MKKNLLFALLLIVMILSSCSIIPVVGTNSKGHFFKDRTFTDYNRTYRWDTLGVSSNLEAKSVVTYHKDGTYEKNYYIYENKSTDINENSTMGEGFILLNTKSGQYSYSDLTMTTWEERATFYSSYSSATSTESWVANPSPRIWKLRWVNKDSIFITENLKETAYLVTTDNTWTCTREWGDEGQTLSSSKSVYTLTKDQLIYTYTSSSFQREWTLDILDRFPTDDSFTQGKTINFNGIYSVYRTRNSPSDPWSDDTTMLNTVGSRGLANEGDFITETYNLDDFARTATEIK